MEEKTLLNLFNPKLLEGKTVLITGGATGLGNAMANACASLGANIIIASRNIERLTTATEEIEQKYSAKVLPVVCDVSKIEGVENLLLKAKEEFGSVDALINNAAGNFISPTENLSTNAFSKIIDIVLKGTINCSLTFGKDWIANNIHGSIINIITTYAFTGSSFVTPSAAAKGGVLALTRSLAVEWGKYGIRHNAIAPGPFPTKGALERLLPGDLAKQFDLKSRVPLNRVGRHEELAGLVVYLLSGFADYINGEVICIDGGEWLQGAGQFNELSALPPEVWEQLKKQKPSK